IGLANALLSLSRLLGQDLLAEFLQPALFLLVHRRTRPVSTKVHPDEGRLVSVGCPVRIGESRPHEPEGRTADAFAIYNVEPVRNPVPVYLDKIEFPDFIRIHRRAVHATEQTATPSMDVSHEDVFNGDALLVCRNRVLDERVLDVRLLAAI